MRDSRKPVIATNLQTGEIMVFPSMKDAASNLHVGISSISFVCTGKRENTCGYKFEYARQEIPTELIKCEAELIVTMADCDLSITKTANRMYVANGTVIYSIKSIKAKTGKDPRKFYDMCELLPMAKAILEEKQC